MKDRISIILAGFNPIFCLGLQNMLNDSNKYHIVHCFNHKDEIEDFIVNGGNADLLIFADNLTDITFIPKDSNIKSLVFTDHPEKFKYDNWFYVGISGTINWNISYEDFNQSLENFKKGNLQ